VITTMLSRALFTLVAGVAAAQTREDARDLLRQVADSARSAKTWRTEGTTIWRYQNSRIAVDFKMTMRRPQSLRFEVSRHGVTEEITVCDGAKWGSYHPGVPYLEAPAGPGLCPTTVLGMEQIADNLRAATFVGKDRVLLDGHEFVCDVVEAVYSKVGETCRVPDTDMYIYPPQPPEHDAATGRRVFCIDRARKLVLRDSMRWTEACGVHVNLAYTTTLSRIERDPELPPEIFKYEPPAGVRKGVAPKPPDGSKGR